MYNTMIQVVFVLGLLAGCSLQSNAHARVVPLIKPHFELTPLTPAPPDTRELDRIRKTEIFKMDGLTGNRADIPAMIATINEKGWSPSANEFTTMLALARLGATEAIPAIEKYCPNPNYYLEEWAAFAYAARARILAETENSPHAQVVRFFKEIGETPDQINIILSQQIQAAASMSSTSSSKSAYKESCAEEELADMIYHGDAAHLLADPLVSQVDFKADPNAWDKVHLALLSPDMQRQYLVNRISSGEYYFFTGQLLIDLGRPQAIEAISAKLAEMDSNPEDYNSKGYSNLLIVLYVCGDHYQSPIWSHLKHPPENPIGNPWGERNQLHEDY